MWQAVSCDETVYFSRLVLVMVCKDTIASELVSKIVIALRDKSGVGSNGKNA